MPIRFSPRVGNAVLIVLMVSSALWSLWVTRDGIGFTNTDSACYVHGARTLLSEGTLLVPDRHGGLEQMHWWPPLYPTLLAGTSLVTGDVLSAARWLSALLYPVSILLLWLLTGRLHFPPWARVLACLVYTFTPMVMTAHIMAMSEAPGLVFWLLSLILILQYEQHQTWPWLLAAAVGAAVALLTRYLCLGQAAAGLLFVLIYTAGSVPRKVVRTLFYGLIAFGPLWCWVHSRPQASVAAATGRIPGFYALSTEQIREYATTLARWLVPLDGHSWFKFLLLGVAAVLIIACIVLRCLTRTPLLPRTAMAWKSMAPLVLLALNLAAIEGILLTTALWLDPTMHPNERYRGFAQVFAGLLAGAWGVAVARSQPVRFGRAYKICVGLLLGIVVSAYALAGALWLRDARRVHLEFGNDAWRRSTGITALQQHFPHAPIYTNYFGPIYFYTGRIDVHYVPIVYSDIHPETHRDWEGDLAEMIKALAAEHGIIVYFKDVEPQMIPVEVLRQNPVLRVVDETDDALFLRAVADEG